MYGVVSSSDSPGLVAWYSRLTTCTSSAGVGQAAHAGAEDAGFELELQDEPRARLTERQRRFGALRHGDIALPSELERLELDLDDVPELLAGADPGVAEVEGGHTFTVANGSRGARPG